MSFNSLQYLVFLPLTVLIFHRLSNKYKPYFLLIVSYLFYLCTHILSPFILLFTTIGGYFFAIKISETISEKDKKSLLFTGILLNIIILLSCREIFKSLIPAIGVSFFTFQNISYLIDCYLGIIQPERNFLYYALYLSFFPKLIQGPIERASNLIPQLKHMKNTICEYETLRGGVQLFFWGMFKKIFIADNIAPVITSILNDINGTSGPVLLIITYLYAIQIYCDFSGYTDMSLGSARLFGINLTNNFNYPYFSPSTQDFWRRWHITLSGWILDYIFKPLSMKGRNYGNYGVITALIITFVICGIWHGLTLNYICWGLYHGILISLSFLTYKKWEKFCKKYKINQGIIYIINVFITFNLVCFSWLFFMTKTLSDVWLILSKNITTLLNFLAIHSFDTGISTCFIIVIAIFFFIEVLQAKFNIKAYFERQNVFIRWAGYYIMIMVIILWGNYGSKETLEFMYFRF